MSATHDARRKYAMGRKKCRICGERAVMHFIAPKDRRVGWETPRDEQGLLSLTPHGHHVAGERHQIALENLLFDTSVAPAGTPVRVARPSEEDLYTTTRGQPFRLDDGRAVVRVDGLEHPVRLPRVVLLSLDEIAIEIAVASAKREIAADAPPIAAPSAPSRDRAAIASRRGAA